MKTNILIFLIFYGFIANAQKTQKRIVKFPVFTTDYLYYPKSNINTDNGKEEIGLSEWETSFQIAFPLEKQKIHFLNKVNYSLFNYNASLEPSGLDFNETYHSIEYTIGLVKVLQKQRFIVFNLSPNISSDLKKTLSSDDFFYQFLALAGRRQNENFQYGFGVLYRSGFWNLQWLPVIDLIYKKEKWLTEVQFPYYISQSYCLNESAKIGMKIGFNSNVYNVDANATNRLLYSKTVIESEFEVKLFGDLYLNAEAGIFSGNLKIKDDELNTKLDLDISNSLFFNVGLKILK